MEDRLQEEATGDCSGDDPVACAGTDAKGRMGARGPALRFRLRSFAETTSTNDEVKRALEAGEPEGLAVCARRQVAGYGRQGRAWSSLDGGLYCSLLLRPKVDPAVLPTLSLVVGMAVRGALATLAAGDAASRVRIKWPNDVVLARERGNAGGMRPRHDRLEENDRYARCSELRELDDQGFCRSEAGLSAKNRSQPHFCAIDEDSNGIANRATKGASESVAAGAPAFAKLCGISLETHAGGVCVGIGVNVVPPDRRVDVGGKNAPAYVADIAPRLMELAADDALALVRESVLGAFAPLYEAWLRAGFEPLAGDYGAQELLAGSQVKVVDQTGKGIASGRVVRVDGFGRLVLRDAAGVETPVSSGEAHIV